MDLTDIFPSQFIVEDKTSSAQPAFLNSRLRWADCHLQLLHFFLPSLLMRSSIFFFSISPKKPVSVGVQFCLKTYKNRQKLKLCRRKQFVVQ
jgi:hypothetical protein